MAALTASQRLKGIWGRLMPIAWAWGCIRRRRRDFRCWRRWDCPAPTPGVVAWGSVLVSEEGLVEQVSRGLGNWLSGSYGAVWVCGSYFSSPAAGSLVFHLLRRRRRRRLRLRHFHLIRNEALEQVWRGYH